jgi:diguanylate cyclase (GGDEF)-like protein
VIDVELTHDDVEVNGKLAKLALVRDVTDQRRLEAELHERAFHDVLTGLANRALLADRFEHAQAVRTREDRGLAVMVLDVDGFKAINDMLGHAGGDGVLREVAQRLRSAVRSRDTVGRLGGDEFAVIFDGADPSDALDLAQRVLSAIDAPMEVDGKAIEVAASAGLTSVDASDVTWEAAMQHADVAMYEAKTEGKASVRVYETGMQSLLLQRLSIASELKRAIAADEMTLHYQPIVPTEGQQQREQVEALVRWQHPSRGLVPPMEFIPVAEQTGTIVQLGTWVLRAACRQIAEWRDQGRLVRVSVNVSGRQLRDADFADVVTHVLAETKVPADQLVLEVTETALLEDLKRASLTLNKLRAKGVQVALDDFGAGYSSINYLSQLPVDVVKIDRAFVISLDNEEKRAVVLTIMRLLGTMKVRTVAEGVETSTQLGYVTSLGIDACQGYLFSPAVPAHDVLAVLDRCSPKMPDARAQTPIAVV